MWNVKSCNTKPHVETKPVCYTLYEITSPFVSVELGCYIIRSLHIRSSEGYPEYNQAFDRVPGGKQDLASPQICIHYRA